MTNGEMNARWMNAEIANWPRGQSRLWKGHIVIVSDRFLILPRGRRNASRTQTRQWKDNCIFIDTIKWPRGQPAIACVAGTFPLARPSRSKGTRDVVICHPGH